jgi:hypothetical protein
MLADPARDALQEQVRRRVLALTPEEHIEVLGWLRSRCPEQVLQALDGLGFALDIPEEP